MNIEVIPLDPEAIRDVDDDEEDDEEDEDDDDPGRPRRVEAQIQVGRPNSPRRLPYSGLHNEADPDSSHINACLQALYVTTEIREYLMAPPDVTQRPAAAQQTFHPLLRALFHQMNAARSRRNAYGKRQYGSIRLDPALVRACRARWNHLTGVNVAGNARAFLAALLDALCDESNTLEPPVATATTTQDPITNAEAAWRHHISQVNNSPLGAMIWAQFEWDCHRRAGKQWKYFTHVSVQVRYRIQHRFAPRPPQTRTQSTHQDEGDPVLPGIVPETQRPRNTLHDCLRYLIYQRMYEDRTCSGCGQGNMTYGHVSTNRVTRPPPILIVHLNRFRHHGERNEFHIVFDQVHSVLADLHHRYRLISVILYRTGDYSDDGGNTGIGGGHYSTLYLTQDGWTLFDDERVEVGVDSTWAFKQILEWGYMAIYRHCFEP